MGLSNTRVPDEQGLNWSEITLIQPTKLDQPEPPLTRRNQQQQYSESLECPRCGSKNTKFCYYNNYNKSQPRHLCKACKRHWTKGGTLRNVVLGNGRKNKRLKPSNAIATHTSDSSISISANTTHTCDQTSTTSCENFLKMDNCTFTFSAGLPPENENVEFCFSSVDALESSTSCNAYGFTMNQENSLESSITTVNMPTTRTVFSQPSTSGAMDVPSYWNWNDIDTLFSTLDTTWNDTDLKF